MTRTRHYAAVLALTAALAGCGDAEPTAAPSPTPAASSASVSPSPAVDDRRACRALDALDDTDYDPTASRDAGALAAEAADPGIRQAGINLVAAANRAVAEPGPDATIELDRAQIALAEACADEYGDGPW